MVEIRGNKSVVVTGASGAVGSFMMERLGTRGVAFSRRELSDAVLCTEALAKIDPGIVFHFASDAHVRQSFDEPQAVLKNNIDCTMVLLEALRALPAPRPKLILASTPEVYGSGPFTGALVESAPIRPANPYAASKAAQEALVHAYGEAFHIPYVVTRAGSYVNPRRKDLALTAFARQIVVAERQKGPSVLRHGNLDTVRGWCDVRDLLDAYLLAAIKGENGAIYNIGSMRARPLEQVLAWLIAGAHVNVTLELDTTLLRPTDVKSQVLNTDAFYVRTGWEPTIELTDSLTWLLDTLRAEE